MELELSEAGASEGASARKNGYEEQRGQNSVAHGNVHKLREARVVATCIKDPGGLGGCHILGYSSMYYNSPCMLSTGIASAARAVLSARVAWYHDDVCT
jgi:hypothetical protein